MPEINANINKAAQDIANVAKDATYVVIGAGVLGYQKAQVQRQDLLKRLGDPKAGIGERIKGARTDLSGAIHTVDAQLEDVLSKVEAAYVPLRTVCPPRPVTWPSKCAPRPRRPARRSATGS